MHIAHAIVFFTLFHSHTTLHLLLSVDVVRAMSCEPRVVCVLLAKSTDRPFQALLECNRWKCVQCLCDLSYTIKLTVCCFMFSKCFHSTIKFIAAWWMAIYSATNDYKAKRNSNNNNSNRKIGHVWWLREKKYVRAKKNTYQFLFSFFLTHSHDGRFIRKIVNAI